MLLKNLISNLNVLRRDLPVRTFNSTGVGKLDSYRGIYEHLAIGPGAETRTVGDLLEEAEETVGKTLQGYKGGDYTMTGDTPIWISGWGESTSIALIDVVTKHGDQGQDLQVVLVGHDITDYLF